jgi:nicotinate-nucleotide pyrophosphorylase (carboxylating)
MRSKLSEFLKEDIGTGDITSELVVPPSVSARGEIRAKEPCVLAGAEEARQVFDELGAEATLLRTDGDAVEAGTVVLRVEGPARALLSGERLALNMLMRMSGIATLTRTLVDECRAVNPRVRVAATRKTTPGFRAFEKRAVAIGGGDPHRSGLDDAVLIKNNHIRLAGGVEEALRRARSASFTKKVEIEVESAEDAHSAVENGADIVMLDNMPPEEARPLAAELRRRRPDVRIEVSGGITPDDVRLHADYADIISLGWLTHSVRSIDFSMTITGRGT